MKYFILGKKFGYPNCCIAEFSTYVLTGTVRTRSERKLRGTGYIPCLECNNKYSNEELVDNINKSRDQTIPAFTNIV